MNSKASQNSHRKTGRRRYQTGQKLKIPQFPPTDRRAARTNLEQPPQIAFNTGWSGHSAPLRLLLSLEIATAGRKSSSNFLPMTPGGAF